MIGRPDQGRRDPTDAPGGDTARPAAGADPGIRQDHAGPEAAGAGGAEAETPKVDRRMLEALVCPATQGRLRYDAARGELISPTARLAFPIRNGIPVLLVSEAREIE